MKNIRKIDSNIYITSDEEIKEDSWVTNGRDVFKPSDMPEYSLEYANKYWKKIILTTDQSLDGVQAIDNEFLEWFIKNPNCERVEVRYTVDFNSKAVIIIPQEEPKSSCPKCRTTDFNKCHSIQCPMRKEEPKQETLEEVAEWSLEKAQEFAINKFRSKHEKGTVTWESILKVLKVGVLIGHKFGAKWQAERNGYKMVIPQEESKQETLEEAAKVYAESYRCPATNDNEYCKHDIISAFNNGAKWQQERMYSEEEVLDIINSFEKLCYNYQSNKDWFPAKKSEWFEQFKKK